MINNYRTTGNVFMNVDYLLCLHYERFAYFGSKCHWNMWEVAGCNGERTCPGNSTDRNSHGTDTW